MKFGLFSLMTMRDHPDGYQGVVADTRVMVQEAESVGFDVAWFGEHHFANYSMVPSPVMMAAQAAEWTKTIGIGTGVIVLPLYHPLRVVQEIALLDVLTNGRAVIGLGTGYQQYEFDRFGVALEDKVDIFLEYWGVIQSALETGEVEFKGKHVTIPHTQFAMRTLRKSLPPVFTAGTHPRILERFKNIDATTFIAASTLGSKVLYKMNDQLAENWRSIGEDPADHSGGIMQYINITDSKQEALEAAERARYVGRMSSMLRHSELPLENGFISNIPVDGEPTVEEYAENIIVGDVYHVAQRLIQDIRWVNPRHYACNFQFGCMPRDRAVKSLHRFVSEVLPLVSRELGPLDRIGIRNAVPELAAQ